MGLNYIVQREERDNGVHRYIISEKDEDTGLFEILDIIESGNEEFVRDVVWKRISRYATFAIPIEGETT